MKGNEEIYLAQALKEMVEIDKELESLKNGIAMKNDFNLLDGFRVLD